MSAVAILQDIPRPIRLPLALRVLEELRVPYALFAPGGQCVHASGTVMDLLGSPWSASPGEFWAQVMRLTAIAQERHRREPAVAPTSLYVAAGCCLTIHAAGHSGVEETLVVFSPAPHGRCADRDLLALGLTPREQQVARLLATGRATKEIAAALGISFHTARHHTERIFQKLGVRGRVAVAAMVAGR